MDTETPSYLVFQQIYQEFGLELPLPVYSACIGTSFQRFNPYTYLSEKVTIDVEAVRNRFRALYADLLEQTGVRDGVLEYLSSAKRLKLKIGLASSSSFSWIEPHLTKHNLSDYFDTIQTSDNVKNVKPDPELYLKALEALEVEGHEAISLEDSLNGFQAAKAAGLRCVVVPNEVTRHFVFPQFDWMLESMADMKLEELIAIINQKKRSLK